MRCDFCKTEFIEKKEPCPFCEVDIGGDCFCDNGLIDVVYCKCPDNEPEVSE